MTEHNFSNIIQALHCPVKDCSGGSASLTQKCLKLDNRSINELDNAKLVTEVDRLPGVAGGGYSLKKTKNKSAWSLIWDGLEPLA